MRKYEILARSVIAVPETNIDCLGWGGGGRGACSHLFHTKKLENASEVGSRIIKTIIALLATSLAINFFWYRYSATSHNVMDGASKYMSLHCILNRMRIKSFGIISQSHAWHAYHAGYYSMPISAQNKDASFVSVFTLALSFIPHWNVAAHTTTGTCHICSLEMSQVSKQPPGK